MLKSGKILGRHREGWFGFDFFALLDISEQASDPRFHIIFWRALDGDAEKEWGWTVPGCLLSKQSLEYLTSMDRDIQIPLPHTDQIEQTV
jgi:hypothetical protein